MNFSSKQEVLDHISKFESLYDYVRIVDPVKRTVIGDEADLPVHCFDFWDKGKTCENCTTHRALSSKTTHFKMEFKKGIVYLITSCPVKINDETYVMEMLKDITDTGIIQTSGEADYEELEKTIEKLNKKVIMDELTDVFNRRYINERLPADLYHAASGKTSLSLILLDLDKFKQLNDSYSHVAGDAILKEVGNILKYNVRKGTDWVARYGGDEFLICLPGADEEAAAGIAEDIRQEIEHMEIRFGKDKLKTTASIGVYTMKAEMLSMEEIIRRTDMKMYQAKSRGRNAVVTV
ncbi:MAG: GGDEF domain-containing protein [Sedimentibacter sp.]|uniref:GGDEF domain-containing protein n=1 Tax=Sedimentibacter sp. TaxID=1960295 RepID=UPI003158A06E